MITNADITIYNRKYNKATRTDIWHRKVIYGASFYVDNKVQQTDNGLQSSNAYKVRVPEENMPSGFVDEDTYYQLVNVNSNWTLQNDDYVVQGEVNVEIKAPKELAALHKPYFKITSWSDNRRGGLPHLRIGGV